MPEVIVYNDGSILNMGLKGAGSGAAQMIYAQALSSATANCVCPIRASTSGWVAYPGSTTGLGSDASFMYSPYVYMGVRAGGAGTLPSGCMGWFQCAGLATIYIGTGTTIVAGNGLALSTASKVAAGTAFSAAYTGLAYHFAIAQEAVAVASVPATYTQVLIVPGPHPALLTT
jgi:hypothetical protein